MLAAEWTVNWYCRAGQCGGHRGDDDCLAVTCDKGVQGVAREQFSCPGSVHSSVVLKPGSVPLYLHWGAGTFCVVPCAAAGREGAKWLLALQSTWQPAAGRAEQGAPCRLALGTALG